MKLSSYKKKNVMKKKLHLLKNFCKNLIINIFNKKE